MCIYVKWIYIGDTALMSFHVNSAAHVDGPVLIMASMVLFLIFKGLLKILKDEAIDGTIEPV